MLTLIGFIINPNLYIIELILHVTNSLTKYKKLNFVNPHIMCWVLNTRDNNI